MKRLKQNKDKIQFYCKHNIVMIPNPSPKQEF